MRNDFGNRPYSVRFPYGSGGSANGKRDKATMTDLTNL